MTRKYNISKILSLFRRFGGFRLVHAYARIGILGTVIKECVTGLFKRKSADKIYYSFQPKIVSSLREKYRPVMLRQLAINDESTGARNRSDVVWFCWLQGLEDAPPIVKACYASLRENLNGKEIRVVTDSNRKQLVQLPDYIEKRRSRGQIPPAMFADLLRLELLIRYGGTWIDATVLCTRQDYPSELLDADLFLFQFARPDDKKYRGVSNWFITACSNNPILMTLRDILYAYWKDFDCVLEYFIFHRFFDMLAKARLEEISQMPYAYSPNSLLLARHLHEPFDRTRWDMITNQVSFHKLAHQVKDSVKNDPNNYYNHILLYGLET